MVAGPPGSRDEELALLDGLFDRLFPICRSITGEGLRTSLSILAEHLPLQRHAVPTGTRVLDWTIPPEWVIRDAWLRGPSGTDVVRFADCNLHVLNYSTAVSATIPRDELELHLYSAPALPDAVPYVTSYYRERWGFCLPQAVREGLPPGDYEAHIDSELIEGGLDYGDLVVRGETDEEILLSTYLCHPSLANNELSGPLVAVLLHRRIMAWPRRRFTYRFVVAPETIGAIAYLAAHGPELAERLHAGLVLTCLGGAGRPLSYKRSRQGSSPIDRIIDHLVAAGQLDAEIRPFDPSEGSDERQWCSPGFDLPVGQAARMVYGRYPEYHTSFDTKELMTIEALQRSADDLELVLRAVELDGIYVNQAPFGEVKLDAHGLHPDLNGPGSQASELEWLRRIRFVLSYADGAHTLTDIASLCGCSVLDLEDAVTRLSARGLLAGPETRS